MREGLEGRDVKKKKKLIGRAGAHTSVIRSPPPMDFAECGRLTFTELPGGGRRSEPCCWQPPPLLLLLSVMEEAR